jgi:5-methylcytosine-specific restriction endonuclease McrA
VRRCYRCRVDKPEDAFIRCVDDRHYSMCRQCVSEILTSRNTGKKQRLAHTETDRVCYLCRRTLLAKNFTLRSNGTFFSACKDCNRHVFAQRRRARLKGASGSYTVREWEVLLRLYTRCPRCLRAWADIPPRPDGIVVTADHVVAIARGGSNTIENIQPLCYSCNSKKGHRTEPRHAPSTD